ARIQSHEDLLVDSYDRSALSAPLLQQLWRIIWLNRFIVAGIIAAAMIVALIATLLATPQYTSTARVQVNRITANVSDVEGVEPEGQVLDYEEFYRTQYALLESASLAERVVRAQNLAVNEDFAEAFNLTDSELGDGSSRKAVEAIAQILLEHVSIKPVTGS